jgi:hypothetical protein
LRAVTATLRILLLACVALCLGAATAFAHVERPSYFPDPAPDTSVKPAAGGAVPKIRSLTSALNRKLPGDTHVVCQPDSLQRALRQIRRAERNGYYVRPADDRTVSPRLARWVERANRLLFKRCKYDEIQPAVTAARNNDRVVIMPGVYTEPTARKAPTQDPACAKYKVNGDKPGTEGEALSYAYQWHCPNDQNLIAVLGREPGSGEDPSPPREDSTASRTWASASVATSRSRARASAPTTS